MVAFAALPLAISFQNCSKVEFAAQEEVETPAASTGDPDPSSPSSPSTPSTPLPPGTAEASAIFESAQKPPLDLIWVIDNSGSMNQEAEQVRQNFSAFMDKVKLDANVRVALISKTHFMAGDTGVTLSAEMKAAGHVQVEQTVGSYNLPIVLAHALCPPAGVYGSSHPCENIPASTELPSPGPNLIGSLSTFFRPGSQKALVFVTDDNSKPMLSTEFLDLFKSLYNQNPTVYGFVGLGAKTPSTNTCVVNEGTVYKSMSSSTMGAVFDICATDWTAHFDKLAKNVVQLVSRTVQLNHATIESIVSVTVNGRVLSPSEYKLANGRVEISATALTGADKYDVKVVYTYKR